MTNAVSLLKELVHIDSTNNSPLCYEQSCETGNEQAMIQYVSDWLEERGFKVEKRPAAPTRVNLVARANVTDASAPWVAFEAHLDTVGAEGMEISPFAAQCSEGCLYGRGSADTKGSLAAMLVALEKLISDDVPVNLIFIGACAEETGCEGIARLELDRWPDAAIVGEPTSNRTVVSHKGLLWFEATVMGQSGHSSAPANSDNAVVRACNVIAVLQQWAKEKLSALRNEDFDRSTLSVNCIEGGTKVNVSPADCTFSVDVRFVPEVSGEDVLQDLRTVLDREFSFDVQLDGVRIAPGLARTKNDRIARALTSGVRKVSRQGGEPGVVHYCSDAGVLQKRGVDCVVFGPGDISQAHGDVEWVSTEEVNRAAEILYQTVWAYCDKI
ncbi:MAG: M20 family metallopeptidase [Planctomycetota bacterium]